MLQNLHRLLTRHEQRALRRIADALGNRNEAAIIAATVAWDAGCSRSTVSTLLRILAAAGVIDAARLGTRGTLIWIRDRDAWRELVTAVSG